MDNDYQCHCTKLFCLHSLSTKRGSHSTKLASFVAFVQDCNHRCQTSMELVTSTKYSMSGIPCPLGSPLGACTSRSDTAIFLSELPSCDMWYTLTSGITSYTVNAHIYKNPLQWMSTYIQACVGHFQTCVVVSTYVILQTWRFQSNF